MSIRWALDWRDASGGATGFDPPALRSRLVGPFDAPACAADAQTCAASDGQISALSFGAMLNLGANGPAAQTCADHGSPSRLVGGHVRWETVACDGEIRFVAPASIVRLFRSAIRAHARPGEPRWRALERLLAATVAEWESAPRHHDPVFAGDGWRCAVPACSSRGPFHDHHIEFRSRGVAMRVRTARRWLLDLVGDFYISSDEAAVLR
jgi:hypothetical protein